MARNVYGGYCRECGRWTPPGFGHFERYRGGWRVHCVECASGRKLPPEGDQAAQDMRRHVRNMVNDGRYGKGIQMTGNERPDIYADGLREERCENCLHCCATVLRTVHGVERTEYECGRRPEFVHRTQGLARCNYWESR